jgi:hypothetical protein
MYSYILQDWVTLRGSSTVTVLGQGESEWLDLTGGEDIVIWLDVKEVSPTSGVVTFSYQTAPTKDADLFQGMVTSQSITVPGITATVVLKDSAAVPLAKWLRWQVQVTSASAWDVTFRILCAVNATGSNRSQLQAR